MKSIVVKKYIQLVATIQEGTFDTSNILGISTTSTIVNSSVISTIDHSFTNYKPNKLTNIYHSDPTINHSINHYKP
jgi:uncharacterized protein YfkK (UPF0435 family)